MIQVLIASAAAEHRSRESKLRHTALKFQRGARRRRGGQHGETLKACWVFCHGYGQQIVGLARPCYALSRFKVMKARGSHGKHLRINPALVHQC